MRLSLLALLLSLCWSAPVLAAASSNALSQVRARGAGFLRAGDWTKAEQTFLEGLTESRRLRLPYEEGRFLSNLGSVYFLSFRSPEALNSFAQARRIGLDSKDRDLEQVATVNMTMIYARYGQWARALDALESLRHQPWSASKVHRAQYLHHRAIYLYRLERFDESDEAFRVAFDYASAIDNPYEIGRLWENWGLSFLSRHDLSAAETCFLASFRTRYLRRNPEYNRLFLHFAHLAVEQGNAPAAVDYAQRAMAATAAGRSNFPAWAAHHAAARAFLLAGQTHQARRQFRLAFDHVRRSRAGVLPLDQIVVSTESSLFSLYQDFIETNFPAALHSPDLMAEVWAAAEENRQASLRLSSYSSSPADFESRFPRAYREGLAKLQRLERNAAASPQARADLDAFRFELWTLESKLGLHPGGSPSGKPLNLKEVQASLLADEALVSFVVGARQSHAWLVTKRNLSARVLPNQADLAHLVNSFRQELSAGKDPKTLSPEYFRKIFGEFFPVLATKPYWTVIVDGPLFDLPLAALPLPDGNGLVADRFTIALSASAPSLSASLSPVRPQLAAFADPIYNLADSRRKPFRNTARTVNEELPRLSGTARETRAVLGLWPGPKQAFLGADANRTNLLTILRQSPGVLHLATHVVAQPEDPSNARLALSLTPESAELEQIGPSELSALRHQTNLIVMTGCASGRGQAVPGAGLIGLSRAWLVSGAQGVLASLWPMPDDSGELATAFYRHLSRLERGPPHRRWALALQSAQREMRQSPDWRSQAPYWASYFLLMRSERSGL